MCEHDELYWLIQEAHAAHSSMLPNCSILSLSCCEHVKLGHGREQHDHAICHHQVECFEMI